MSGRYVYEHRKKGDVASASPSVLDFGKKLLGYLAEQRRLGLAKTLSISAAAPDGSIVRARFDGDIPAIDVLAAQPRARRAQQPPFTPEGIVVTARNTALPAGIDADHPQQILQFAEEEWTTYFYDASSDTFTAFTGNKGTYVRRFRDGIDNAGNLDWIGAKPEGGTDADRVRLNYYGPMRRYWYDGWRKPDAQYGRWVFLNGQVLLDIEAVNTERAAADLPTFDETLVLGAAYRDGWLYVMQARIADFDVDPNEIPDADGFPPGGTPFITAPYPDGDAALRLVRYRVRARPSEPPRAPVYVVRPNSAETLWQRTARGQVNPWVFNPDVTACETFCMPDELRAIRNVAWAGGSNPTTKVTDTPASASSEHISLAISHGDAVSAVSTITELSVVLTAAEGFGAETPPGLYSEVSATIAADYTPDGERVELVFTERLYNPETDESTGHVNYYSTVRIGSGPEMVVADHAKVSTSPSVTEVTWQAMALLDLRFGIVVTDGYFLGADGVFTVLSIYQFGSLIGAISEPSIADENTALYRFFWWRRVGERVFKEDPTEAGQEDVEEKPVSPMFLFDGVAMYGQYLQSGLTHVQTETAFRPGGGRAPVSSPGNERMGWVSEGINNFSVVVILYSMTTADAPLSTASADVRGYRTPAALAVEGTRVALSLNRMDHTALTLGAEIGWRGAGPAQRAARNSTPPVDPFTFYSTHYMTDASLPTLTGIDDDGARFAPIWQFGAYPQL